MSETGPPLAGPPPGLGAIAVRGVAVSMVSQLTRTALQIASVVVLARLLSPTDYGLVAMVLAVIGAAELFRDLGLSPAAIRAPTLSDGEASNLFWLNTATGAVLSVLAAVAAPAIAWGYGRPELVAITLALAPTFLLSGLATQHRVNLTRRLLFGRLAALDLVAVALPLVIGIVVAALGGGYWALVVQQLSSGVVSLVLTVGAARWRPAAYDRSVPVGSFVRLGSSFLLASLLGYVSHNADTVLIGRRFGAADLGIYNRSVQLVRTPLGQLQSPFGTVVLPVLSAARDDDERLLSAARRAQLAFSYPVLVVVAIVVANARDFVEVTLGGRWLSAAPTMTFIAIAAALQAVAYVALWIFEARGLARTLTLFNVLATILTLAFMGLGSLVSVTGVAAGYAAASALGWPMALVCVRRGGRLPVRDLAWAGVRALAVGSSAAAAGYLVHGPVDDLPIVVRLAATSATVLVVVVVAAALPPIRKDYVDVRAMIVMIRRRPRRGSAAESATVTGR